MNFQPCDNPTEKGESGGDCFTMGMPKSSHGFCAHAHPRDTNKFKGLSLERQQGLSGVARMDSWEGNRSGEDIMRPQKDTQILQLRIKIYEFLY